MVILGLLRVLQALAIKLIPLLFALCVAMHYKENPNFPVLGFLGFIWFGAGPKFRGPSGIRWRAWCGALVFCIMLLGSSIVFIDVLQWYVAWMPIALFTSIAMVVGEEATADAAPSTGNSELKNEK